MIFWDKTFTPLSVNQIKKLLPLWLIGALTLGLAPFHPEPHLIGKLRWVAGGAKGMQLLDWFDLLLHGLPWLLLFLSVLFKTVDFFRKKHN